MSTITIEIYWKDLTKEAQDRIQNQLGEGNNNWDVFPMSTLEIEVEDTKKKYICPHCNKELDTVNVYSQCIQRAVLEDGDIVSYGTVEEILETQDIECPECSTSIRGLVGE